MEEDMEDIAMESADTSGHGGVAGAWETVAAALVSASHHRTR